jgi:hypothetical protein
MTNPHATQFGRIAAVVLVGSAILSLGNVSKGQTSSKFNQPGDILITDQFNNRVIEIDPDGNIVWQFGNGPGDTSANAIVGTNDAERVGNFTLMSGTGIPAGATSKKPVRLRHSITPTSAICTTLGRTILSWSMSTDRTSAVRWTSMTHFRSSSN